MGRATRKAVLKEANPAHLRCGRPGRIFRGENIDHKVFHTQISWYSTLDGTEPQREGMPEEQSESNLTDRLAQLKAR